jgi:hypothetical protein
LYEILGSSWVAAELEASQESIYAVQERDLFL